MEGVSHEAISLAGHLKLSKLIVLFDDNGISIDGPTSLSESGDQVARFEAAGWAASRVDGHDPEAVAAAHRRRRKRRDRPSLIACRTIIGYGAPKKQGTASAHGAALGAEEAAARESGARLAACAVRNSGEHSRRVARGGRARPRRARGVADARSTAANADAKAAFERR